MGSPALATWRNTGWRHCPPHDTTHSMPVQVGLQVAWLGCISVRGWGKHTGCKQEAMLWQAPERLLGGGRPTSCSPIQHSRLASRWQVSGQTVSGAPCTASASIRRAGRSLRGAEACSTSSPDSVSTGSTLPPVLPADTSDPAACSWALQRTSAGAPLAGHASTEMRSDTTHTHGAACRLINSGRSGLANHCFCMCLQTYHASNTCPVGEVWQLVLDICSHGPPCQHINKRPALCLQPPPTLLARSGSSQRTCSWTCRAGASSFCSSL